MNLFQIGFGLLINKIMRTVCITIALGQSYLGQAVAVVGKLDLKITNICMCHCASDSASKLKLYIQIIAGLKLEGDLGELVRAASLLTIFSSGRIFSYRI